MAATRVASKGGNWAAQRVDLMVHLTVARSAESMAAQWEGKMVVKSVVCWAPKTAQKRVVD